VNKKVLVIGNNTEDTDNQTQKLAHNDLSRNHGLLQEGDAATKFGYYHSSIADASSGYLIETAKTFDEVILLDQPMKEWTSKKILLSTLKLFQDLERNSNYWGITVKYKDNRNTKIYNDWIQYFKTNKSFCIYPWVFCGDDGGTVNLCERSGKKMSDVQSIDDWGSNSEYKEIRQQMLDGKRMPENCSVCYEYEDKGMTSYRVHDSLDFIAELGIESIDDLEKIESPHYYDIRSSNKCNLMCRMCKPQHSHLLKKEFDQHPDLAKGSPQQGWDDNYKFSKLINTVDVNTLTDTHTVYLCGGEPTIMKETYSFMRNCIDAGNTDFKLTIGTNAHFFSETFWDLSKHFTQLHFSVSCDGYGVVNDYIRWNSNWDKLIENCEKIKSLGHQFTWNHVPTIWGIHRTHEFFEFASKNFPMELLYLQYNSVDLHSAFISPMIDECIESLRRTKETKLYHSDGKDCTSGIDSLLAHYESYQPEPEKVEKFFRWNDIMDSARNIKLKDYIPDLESYRPASLKDM